MKNSKLQVGGFPEWLPNDQAIENKTKSIISNKFNQYGYINIQTPAVERNDVLTSKSGSDVSKQIYGLYGLAQGPEDNKDYSLHFDLTVPLARYIIDHEKDISFPFKRYQMQKVWRGERHQKGRFKEFYQCDVDVIDQKVDIGYDAEVIEILYKTLEEVFGYLGINKQIKVKMSNKKLFDSICKYFKITEEGKKIDLKKLLDDYHKLESDNFNSILKDFVGDDYQKFIDIFNLNLEDSTSIEDEELKNAFSEIKYVHDKLKEKGINIDFDPYIVRGLDYYSGTVFETFLEDHENIGSICSGGRFDNLVQYIRNQTKNPGTEYEGVGGSIGLSRLLHTLNNLGLIKSKEALSDVIIFNLRDNAEVYREEIADILRSNNISVDNYFKDEKIGKQMKYAESKNIPIGIFAGESEQENNTATIKDLNQRKEFTVPKDGLTKETKKILKGDK